MVEDRLAELILEDRVDEGENVEFDVSNGEIKISLNSASFNTVTTLFFYTIIVCEKKESG